MRNVDPPYIPNIEPVSAKVIEVPFMDYLSGHEEDVRTKARRLTLGWDAVF